MFSYMLCNCMVFLIFAMIDTHAHSVMNQKNLMVNYGESGVAYRVYIIIITLCMLN